MSDEPYFLLVDTLLVAAILAVGLLPYVPVGDGRETWATAPHGSAAMCSLNRNVSGS